MAASSTFIKITNKDIFRRIEDMETSNTKQHAQILLHQKETNGKVKLNRWIATTCITMILALAGIVFSLL